MARELSLKYGCNPNQKPARIFMEAGELPVTVLNGRPGYINFLDALNGWQLVRELSRALGLPAATSFKHVSPAGAAVGVPLTCAERLSCFTGDAELSPLACAYARARGTDRMSSYGDFIALSEPCDAPTARLISREVSDGVIAPGYSPHALSILKAKRGGGYTVVQIDPDYEPAAIERKTCFGVTFEQGRNALEINDSLLRNVVTQRKELPDFARRDLVLSLITLKYTQSNSVCYAYNGQTVGVGAGQQSRVHCTRLAGDKADIWFLRQHPAVLARADELLADRSLTRAERDNAIENFITGNGGEAGLTHAEKRAWLDALSGVSLGSDAFFPFGDNIRRAAMSGVSYVAEPGGSIRDDDVIAACDDAGMVMAFTGVRLFHH